MNSDGDFPYPERHVRIDNTHLSASEAAQQTVGAFSFPLGKRDGHEPPPRLRRTCARRLNPDGAPRRAGTRVLDAAVREVWEGAYGHAGRASPEYCFQVEMTTDAPGRTEAALGVDPEEAHLPAHRRLLQGAAWVPLSDLTGDAQVARVLLAMPGGDDSG